MVSIHLRSVPDYVSMVSAQGKECVSVGGRLAGYVCRVVLVSAAITYVGRYL
jgi:hypothetical protein